MTKHLPIRSSSVSQHKVYHSFLTELRKRISDARHRALSFANRELVKLYREIGQGIAERQKRHGWGEAIVEQLSEDLRSSFPHMRGFSSQNLWQMRKFYLAYAESKKLQTLSVEIGWSQNLLILWNCKDDIEKEFYLRMAVREGWSYRELKRQIEADLFTRYALNVKKHPEKALPKTAEKGALLPFKDSYVLEFLGLEEIHSEQQLRKAILANLRDFFLEFGHGLTFVGEEHPLTIDGDTFRVDLLFFHRELQCLIAVELKIGAFKPEYVGKMQFYLQALDEQEKRPHEKPSIGLILCKSKNSEQVRIALTSAAKKIGVATYQTKLPDRKLLLQKLHKLSLPKALNEE